MIKVFNEVTSPTILGKCSLTAGQQTKNKIYLQLIYHLDSLDHKIFFGKIKFIIPGLLSLCVSNETEALFEKCFEKECNLAVSAAGVRDRKLYETWAEKPGKSFNLIYVLYFFRQSIWFSPSWIVRWVSQKSERGNITFSLLICDLCETIVCVLRHAKNSVLCRYDKAFMQVAWNTKNNM